MLYIIAVQRIANILAQQSISLSDGSDRGGIPGIR